MPWCKKKLRDPEFLNLLARPRYDPSSASIRRRLLSLVFVALVAIYAAYEINRGSNESEYFSLSSTAVYERGFDFDTDHQSYITERYGFEIGRAIGEIWKTQITSAQSSWMFLDPETKGNIPPPEGKGNSEEDKTDGDFAIMNLHNVGTVEQDGINYANMMPEYPLVVTVYGEAAKHAVLVQNFQQASLCRDKLLKYLGGFEASEGEDSYNSYYAQIYTHLSGEASGIGLENGKRTEAGQSSSTLVVTKVDKKDIRHAPWFGTGVYRDFSECDKCSKQMSCRHSKCFASARVKLCGRRHAGSINRFSTSQPDTDVTIQMPMEHSNNTVEVSIESIAPGEFGCDRRMWFSGGDDNCKHESTKRSKASNFDLQPYEVNVLMSKMRLRLREAYYPYYDGYGLEYTGMVKTRTIDPLAKSPESFGQGLTLTLNGINFFRVKPRYSAFGVIGGMASVIAAVVGFLADLCDPSIDYDEASSKESEKEESSRDNESKPAVGAGDIEFAEINSDK